ncbi:MAG TPA: trypsin-like peptidase domain-containing protein, partial [Bauldia sp.]|nr:trypsin-like peptidase domain-containing protein [Bauldia sp.]
MLPRRAVSFGLVLALGLPLALPLAAAEKTVPDSAAAIQLSFAPIVKRVAPAVVNVYASRTLRQSSSPFSNDPFFRRFFGDGGGGPAQRVQRSLGSGVLVDASGIIVTNNHVIAQADEIRVALADRREFNCDVILKDERTDLAVLKIRDGTGDFPFVAFADSDGLEVGDLVLAIGDPFGVGQTVTSGIVSALARTQVGVSDYQFFIQTDAAINPGNSGGALIDMSGRLVGINTAIFSRTGDSSGIGFAIPSNMVGVVVRSAKEGGHVRLPWTGVGLQAVTPDIADGLGLAVPRGALVTSVARASAGFRAGLKSGDLVT